MIKRNDIKGFTLKVFGYKVTFKTESIKGKFRAGYYLIKVSHSFRCFADKLKGSIKIKEQLNKLEVL